MAEVSATFAALVFAGLAFYLESIREAVSKVEADLGMQEQPSRVMVVSVLSNLSFFVLPFIASISLIVKEDIPNIFWLDFAIGCVMVGALLRGFLNKKTLQQVRLTWKIGNRLASRLILGGIGLVLFVALHYVLLAAILEGLPWFSQISQPVDVLKAVTFCSILLGLACGIIDLILFDTDSILFQVTDRIQERLNRWQRDFHVMVQRAEQLHRKYESTMQSSEFLAYLEDMKRNASMAMLDPHRIDVQVREEKSGIRATYNRIHREVPEDCEAKCIRQFRAKGEIVTYADLRRLKAQKELLSEDIKGFIALLKGKLDSFEERGVLADDD